MALDEDEEKARVVSTAGVDAEDANVSSAKLFVAFSLVAAVATWRNMIG